MEKVHEKFLHEAAELIDDLEKAVLQLEKSRDDHTQQEEVFRVMHTFKGTAKMFGFDSIGEYTHYLENIFDELRNTRIKLTDEILEVTLQSVDYIREILKDPDVANNPKHKQRLEQVKKLATRDNAEQAASDQPNTSKANGVLYLIHFTPHATFLQDGSNPIYLLEDLSALGEIYCKPHTDRMPVQEEFKINHAYLYFDILLYTRATEKDVRREFMFVEDQCALQIETIGNENLLHNKSFVEFADSLRGNLSLATIFSFTVKQNTELPNSSLKITTEHRSGKQSIRVTYEKIDKLMSIVSEMVTTQARLSLYADTHKTTELEEIAENVEKLVRQLRDEAFSISLLPISNLSMRFERLVRDTSRELQKKIRFITSGSDTELDKKIIENLMDPMLHIFRNSMDHGIELPEERKRKGKDETGTIHLKSYYSGTNVIIEVQDDGAGIDKEKVLKKAIQRGLAKETDQLTDHEIFDFIFHSGFSTASKITDVSGRGVGMDVIRRAVSNLRGEIEVDSVFGTGTTIRLRLPLSLSIIDGLLVNIDRSKYVIPLSTIDKCYEVESDTIKPDMNDLIVLDGEQIPYVNLRHVFDCNGQQPAYVNLIVACHEDKKVAFEVDNIVDEYQAVIKPLGKIYKHQDFASGATILGNGTVALVLDTNRLISKLSDN